MFYKAAARKWRVDADGDIIRAHCPRPAYQSAGLRFYTMRAVSILLRYAPLAGAMEAG